MWHPKRPRNIYGLRDIVEQLLPEDQVEDFASWAFGEDYNDFGQIKEFMQAWNKIHHEELMLGECGIVVEDVYKMVQIYLFQKDSDGQKRLSN